MSVIRKKPFIEMVIDTLSLDLRNALKSVLDNNPETINRNSSFADMPSVNTVTAVYFKLDEMNYKNGILIYNNSYCVLVAYHRFQDLLMYDLDVAKKQYRKVNEYLDINEFRRVLNDKESSSISAGEIDSGSEPANKVLVSDGDGGAEWANAMDTIAPETVEEGDAVQLFGFNSEGQLVKDAIPEGITVDQTIIEDSENAVAGGAVYDLKEDVEALQSKMENKANVDGNYPTMTVGVADNLSPYDENSGDDQDTPFSLQATGTGNGTQPDFSTGAIALMKEKQGNTVVVNQYAKAITNVDWSANNGTLSIADGVGTFTANASGGSSRQAAMSYVLGHKYLLMANIKLTTANNQCKLAIYDGILQSIAISSTTNKQLVIGIVTAQNTVTNGQIQIRDDRASDWDAIEFSDVRLVDLTQWFNGDIPQDLLDNPSNFFRYYQGSLAYNEGELVNADGRYIKCIGMNQWDEEWELGGIDSATGNNTSSSQTIRSKNYIKVIPNAEYQYVAPYYCNIRYYDVNKNYLGYTVWAKDTHNVIPSNVCYIRFVLPIEYGATYNNDISINLYYADEPRCLTYKPYKALTNNDTGTEVLRSAGSVKDTKAHDGTITRRIGVVDLGSLTWVYNSGEGRLYFYAIAPSNEKTDNPQAICSKYVNGTYPQMNNGNYIMHTSSGYIWVKDSSFNGDVAAFKTAMSGVYLFYELSEPTTEQGTLFSENLVIDDFGSMDFGGTNGVPQGALIFYPVDYKAYLDTLHKYTEGTPSNLALNSELNAKFESYLKSLSGYDASATQTLKNVEGTLTWVTEGE